MLHYHAVKKTMTHVISSRLMTAAVIWRRSSGIPSTIHSPKLVKHCKQNSEWLPLVKKPNMARRIRAPSIAVSFSLQIGFKLGNANNCKRKKWVKPSWLKHIRTRELVQNSNRLILCVFSSDWEAIITPFFVFTFTVDKQEKMSKTEPVWRSLVLLSLKEILKSLKHIWTNIYGSQSGLECS